jgi:hypothetical protein
MKTKSEFPNRQLKSMVKLLMTASCGVLLGLTTAWAAAPTLWTGGGPGTTVVVSDGSVRNPQFTYSLIGNTHSDQTWDFHTTNDLTGTNTVTLPYCWRGFHAFFQVTAHLEAYVIHNGVTTTTPLVNDGPVDCCTQPSGGFHYEGSVNLSVQAGDQYGFRFGGQNFDSNETLQGTFTVFSTNAPVCDAGGPYTLNATATGTNQVQLDGTGSSDADGDLLTYLWTTDCANATFDDPTSPTPILTYNINVCETTNLQCMVTLTVDDGCDTSTCSNSVTVTATVGNKCPLTQGYWKSHAEAWPVSSLSLGTVIYTQAELLAILNSSVKGDASLILAYQLIAAKLNIANGSNPCPIQSTIAAADALIAGRTIPITPKISPSKGDGPQMVSLAATLELYNSGVLTPGCTP